MRVKEQQKNGEMTLKEWWKNDKRIGKWHGNGAKVTTRNSKTKEKQQW